MKSCKMNLLASAAASLMIAGPAIGQTTGSTGSMTPMGQGETMTESIDPGSGAVIRIITRPSAPGRDQGAGDGSAAAPGGDRQGGEDTESDAASSDIDQAIRRADGATTGVTDPAGGDAATGNADELGFDASGMTDEGQGGDETSGQMSGGMPDGMDMEAFARELFEQGYRQGYVSALTELRTRAARDSRMRQEQADREARQRRDAQAERERSSQVQIIEDPQGNTVVMLPPGMTPQMFLERLQQGQSGARQSN